MSDIILEELNVECVGCFLELILDKSSSFIQMNTKWYEIAFARDHKISHYCPIKFIINNLYVKILNFKHEQVISVD
ncbi:MAG: hypothetical protein ACTS78_01745 [Arsenophonus sp. NC-WZS1-MAG3]